MSGVDTAVVLGGVAAASSVAGTVAKIGAGVGGAAAGAAGAATTAAGQRLQGQVNANQLIWQGETADFNAQVSDYQATVANNNAAILRMSGARVVQAGEVAADTEGMKTVAVVGKMKANQGANNIDVNTGSAVDVRADAAAAGKLNQETTLSNAQLANWGYRAQATTSEATAGLHTAEAGLHRSQGNFYRSQVPLALRGANLAAQGTEIGGVGSLLNSVSALPTNWLGGLGGSGTKGDTITAAGPQGTGPGGTFTTAEGVAMGNAAGLGFGTGSGGFGDVGSLIDSLGPLTSS